MTQQDFVKEIKAVFSAVNRWSGSKSKSNLSVMKNVNEFCLKRNIGYSGIEEAVLDFKDGRK